jgi:FlaA1/EpsC-like NDP-sugar epimerase
MKWGAIGAAWGTMISGIISCSISFNVAQRFYRIRWEYKKISSIFFIFFGSAIAMILLRYFDISYLVRLAIKLISLAGYAYLGIKFNILTRENYLLAKNIFSINRGGSY